MDRIRFRINGVEHSVGSEVTSDVTLLDYIRNTAELRGTKYMCREAGCGACIVTAVRDPHEGPVGVNSCMVSITSCQDWNITTVEKVGNRRDGYSVVQTTLAKSNGTQCGHCTPGWIMAMYSLLQSKRHMTKLEIEKSFASNVCRCTGYRPILDAFKKFAIDAKDPHELPDIEELHICKKNCKKDCKNCKEKADDEDWCLLSADDIKNGVIKVELKDGRKWFKVQHVAEIFATLNVEGDDSYMLVAGNTAKGAYPIFDYPRILIDISSVNELKGYTIDQNLNIGAGTTLTELLDILNIVVKEEYFSYLQPLIDHLMLVAHIPVRNIGTIAGNLMIKHQHNDFPSDLFLLFETVGAQLIVENSKAVKISVTMQDFLRTDMTKKVILNVMLPPLTKKYHVVTFKIMPRSQNAHAIVNAGFLYKLENNQVAEARIVYGGLSPTFVRANETESFLIGKQIFANETLQAAIAVLDKELVVIDNPPEPSVLYRKKLAINLFYKGLLTLCPKELLYPRYHTGATKIHEVRPVSSGQQKYLTYPELWPLNQPIPKLEALIQCSGEAPYSEDIPSLPREVFAAFVLSTVPTGNIVHMDPSEAIKQPGVVGFYTAKDIPGENTFVSDNYPPFAGTEEILCSGEVKYFNQAIAIVVAADYETAVKAAQLVKVTYANVNKPVTNVKEAKKDPNRNTLYTSIEATDKGTDVVKVIEGENTLYGQYHFTMENLVCVSIPSEHGLQVYPTSQYIDNVQALTAQALKIDANRVDVKVVRLGGGYGIKISRANQVAIACNLVAFKLNRPCRFIMPLTTCTKSVGKRFPNSIDYQVAVNKTGLIQYFNYNLYEDNGYKVTEMLSAYGTNVFYNCYDKSRWNYLSYNTLTDMAKNTWCRSPSTLENIAYAELVMERISYELSLDPLSVRITNLDDNYRTDVTEMFDTLKTEAHYTERRKAVDDFNSNNRWKKRGLRYSVMRWPFDGYTYWGVTLSVYHQDGTVAISHSGIEMGQGVNTKAAQVCAYLLNIPLDKIKIKRNDTMLNPNGFASGGSFTSTFVCVGVRKCCEELLTRLQPIKETLNNPTWEQLISEAFLANVNLQTHGFIGMDEVIQYDVYGVALAEVEVDILTGEIEVLRVDLLQDVGRSISPEVDVGQVEGAFMMGLGYWTSEHLVYSKVGELLSDRTWNYHVPQARDIPQDFRINFRRKTANTEIDFGSKVTGEPPICLAICVPFAIREAIASARLESGYATTTWFNIDGPYTAESIMLATATNLKDFKFH